MINDIVEDSVAGAIAVCVLRVATKLGPDSARPMQPGDASVRRGWYRSGWIFLPARGGDRWWDHSPAAPTARGCRRRRLSWELAGLRRPLAGCGHGAHQHCSGCTALAAGCDSLPSLPPPPRAPSLPAPPLLPSLSAQLPGPPGRCPQAAVLNGWLKLCLSRLNELIGVPAVRCLLMHCGCSRWGG